MISLKNPTKDIGISTGLQLGESSKVMVGRLEIHG